MRADKKQKLARLRHFRVRQKVAGTLQRPRMSVRFTNENIYVQFIDDAAGRTLAAAPLRLPVTASRRQEGSHL